MYLGNGYNFNSLDSFLTGFTIAASDGQLQLNDYPNFRYFSIWLLGHLDIHFGLAGGWHWQIINRNPNNDEKAFEEFFTFLEVFKSSKTHTKSIIVDKEAIKFKKASNIKSSKIIDGMEIPPDETPFKIIWTTIDNSTTAWLDYIDKNGKLISGGTWRINADEVTNDLVAEFGCLKNDWVEDP